MESGNPPGLSLLIPSLAWGIWWLQHLWAALSLLWLVLALGSVASKGGTRCGKAPAGSALGGGVVRVQANFPFSLGRRTEKGIQRLVPGSGGPGHSPSAQAPVPGGGRRHQHPGGGWGWGEINICMKRAKGWELGDVGWAWISPKAGGFPFGSQFSYL